MKTLSTVLLTILATLTLACGYGSSYNNTGGGGNGSKPAISTLNPNSATAGGAAFTLTVNGSNFASKATINWNGAAQATTAYVSAGQLTLNVPASMIASSGTVMISVTNPATSNGYGGGNPAQTSTAVSFMIN